MLEVQGNERREADEIVVIPTSQKPVIREWVADQLTLADHSDDALLFVGLSNQNREGWLSTRAIRAMVESRYQLAGVVGNRKTTHRLCHSAITNAIPARGFTNASPGYAMARHVSCDTTLGYFHQESRTANPAEDFRIRRIEKHPAAMNVQGATRRRGGVWTPRLFSLVGGFVRKLNSL